MQILLIDTNGELVQAWQEEFRRHPYVKISLGSILDHRGDAIVSPANSFGFMDGGIDLLYSEHFGWELQDRLQELIRTEWFGELPVGEAVVLPTGSSEIPFLVSAPTMRVPMDVSGTLNPYLAFRAVLLAIHRHNVCAESKIDSVLSPGLGTGVGKVSPSECARQMYAAYVSVQEVRMPARLGEAQDTHWSLISKRKQPPGT